MVINKKLDRRISGKQKEGSSGDSSESEEKHNLARKDLKISRCDKMGDGIVSLI